MYFIPSAGGSPTISRKFYALQTTDFPALPRLFPRTPLRFSTVYTSHCQQVLYLQHPTRFRHTTDHRFPCTSKAFSMHHFHQDFPHHFLFYTVSKRFTHNIPRGSDPLQTTNFPAFPGPFPRTPLRFSTVYTLHCQQGVYLQHPTRFKHTVGHRFPYISKAFSMHHLY